MFWAAPGEYNDVTATAARNENGGAWLIHDGGAVLDAAAPCQSVDQHTVSCAAYPEHYLSNARFELGDLDDRLQTVSPPEEADELGVIGEFFADGGPGNDRLSGDSDGAISPAPPTTGANVGAWLSLSGISFRCAPSGQDGCP